MNLIKRLIKDEEGQGLVEYALIVGLIALAAVAAMKLTGASINGMWTAITTALDDAH